MYKPIRVLTVALSILLSCSAVSAKCLTDDKWTGKDKRQHFAGGAMAGAFLTVVTKDPWNGFYAGSAVAVLGETGGVCSVQDMVVGIAGAALGAYTAGKVLVAYDKKQKTLQVSYAVQF